MVFCHVPFLFFIVICSVTVARLHRYRNPFAILSQFVSIVIVIRSEHFGKPQAAVGVRFIVPANMNTPTKWQTEMRVW